MASVKAAGVEEAELAERAKALIAERALERAGRVAEVYRERIIIEFADPFHEPLDLIACGSPSVGDNLISFKCLDVATFDVEQYALHWRHVLKFRHYTLTGEEFNTLQEEIAKSIARMSVNE